MLAWRKRIPILVIAISILALGAIALSDISPEQGKVEAMAQINAERGTGLEATLHPDVVAKLATEQEILERIAAEEEAEEDAIVTKDAYANRDNFKGVASIAGHPMIKYDPRTVYFSEDFEDLENFPPIDWDTVNTDPGYGFFSGIYSTGTQAALVTWHAAGYVQDEWMISPSADLSSATSDIRLEFWFLKGYSYPHEFKVYVATDGVTFNLVWDSDVEGAGYPEFTWTQATIIMNDYIGEASVTIGFQYYGIDADLFGLDDVVLTDDAAATGRCCYGPDPYSPTCEDGVTAEYCSGVAGSWLNGGNCVDDPCPIPEENDDCDGATPQSLPYTFTGSNEAATFDAYCQWFGDYPNVWIAFTIDECTDVTIDYCASPAGWGNGWLNLITDCTCPDGDLLTNSSFDWGCANGNPQIYFNMLPAGTYYYPVMLDPANGASGDYGITVSGTACPPVTPGDNCSDPFVVNVGSGDLPYTIAGQNTCGRIDYHNTSCLGSYDGGEDLIVELIVADAMVVNITLDPKGTTWSGMAIASTCAGDPCIASVTSSSGSPKTMNSVSLAAGTYYIIVDTYPSPDCIPDLDIIIEAPPEAQEGDNCLNPIKVDLPAKATWSDLGQTTCGRIDDYDATCMGYYDGGEDIIYEISVASTVTVNITLDPKGTTYSGLGLFASCPSEDVCIDYETGYSSDPKTMSCVTLEPGVYYLMIDTWPSPDCIPEFDLFITDTTCEALENDDCADATPIGEVTDLAFSTETATADGPLSCQYASNVWYAYTATQTGNGVFTLCGSGFDTKLAVYDGSCAGAELGCNDDSPCDFATRSLQSTVELPVVSGNTYLVEVGGYSSNTGDGVLSIWVEQPCEFACPPGATPEGEDCIPTDGEDDTNGGCNSVPPVFGSISCGETVCGNVNTYLYTGLNYRDTDWYGFTLNGTYACTLTFSGNFPFVSGFLEQYVPGGGLDCGNFTGNIAPYDLGDGCEDTIVIAANLSAGTYAVFAGATVFTGLDCATGPHEYWMTLTCDSLEATYCEGSGGCDEYLENVTVGEINNTTGCDGYANYTDQCATMEAGGSYPITITIGNAYSSDEGGVWIDWNQDLDFDDAGEQVTLDVASGYGPYTGTIVVPEDAAGGETRMRVRVTWNTAATPCGAHSYGEVEDYCILLGDPIPTWMANPDTVYSAVKFVVGVGPVTGAIYITSEAVGGIDVNTITGVGMNVGATALAVTSEVVAAPYPMTGDALKVTYNQRDLVLAEETVQGDLIWGHIDSFFDVTFNEGGPFSGSIVIRGHTAGDLNLDDAVNVADVTFMVSYLFTGGPAPQVMQTADVDASGGEPNITDLTVLVSYLFTGGSAPVHP